MNNIKRFAVALAVVAAFVAVYAGFQGNDILDRAIILGIGIDAEEDGGVTVTAEVVSPGNGAEEVGTYSKVISATGKSVVDALNSVSLYCGKEVSLGQCAIVVFGKDYVKGDAFASCLKFLIRSESLKESSMICCASGRAEQILAKSDAIGKSVSLALSDKMLSQAKETAVPTNNLLKFCRSQEENDRSGFLNVVSARPTNNADETTDSDTQSVFSVDGIAVFKNKAYLLDLTEKQADGMSLLKKGVTGQLFVVEQQGYKLTLQVSKKDVSAKFDGKTILLNVKLVTRPLEADMKNQENDLAAKTKSIILPESLRQVEKQAAELANACLLAQIQNDFDLTNFHETVRRKQGSSSRLFAASMDELPFKLTITAVDD